MGNGENVRSSILVIGATGGIGGAVAQAFLQSGWSVRALNRREPADLNARTDLRGIEWHQGDAMFEEDVVRAARGVDVIFHGANPPMYRRWRELAIPMLASSIAAARASGARLILPGTIYNFGPDAGHLLQEDAPQNPLTRKGQVRAEMELMLQQAAQTGVRSIIVRAGDFFGWQAPSSWFQTLMIKPSAQVRTIWFPGEHDIGHCWAYLPDLAQAIYQIVRVEKDLSNFEIYHFGGHWTQRSVEMAQSIQRVCGNPNARIRKLPWPLLRLMAPLVSVFKEMIEMKYLWHVPLRLDNRKLVSLIGIEPHTPFDEAVKTSLSHLGCLTVRELK